MSTTTENNKRIAKNTLLLYFRMLLTMVVSLYTSRVVLHALGVEDYGIYNVVGGVVTFLGFLNGTLSTASSRYITVALGEGNIMKMRQVFASVLQINILLAIIVLILSETIGLWFLYNKMVIPSERMTAALWVYHFSILTVMLNIVSIPYNASIIAHEKMKSFAYISIFDAFAKLLIAYLLTLNINYDKLIIYSLLLLLVQFIDRIIYCQYCITRFPETKYTMYYNKYLIKEMMSFISWSAYGSFVSVGFNQGLNILLNMFFGPAINAARAIAVQVQNAVVSFVTNFHVAFNPQLMKTVTKNNKESTAQLLFLSTRISFYLLCLLGLPIISETKFILQLWLGAIPEHTIPFIQLMLTISIWQSLANPLRIINQAEGNIKKFQLYECSTLLLIVPISYLLLKLNYPAIIVFIIHLCIEVIANFVRINIVLPKINVSISYYIKNIYLRFIPIFTIPLMISNLLKEYFNESIVSFLFISIIIEIILIFMIYLFGLDIRERYLILSKLKIRK